MAIKFTAESFLEIVKRSRLVSQDQLQRVLSEAKAAGTNIDDSRTIAETLVDKTGLTRWQADKLLQGKHKGFFLGKYRLLSLLGKGGMGSVYLAEHTLMRRRCAIKVLPAKRVNDTSYLGRFHREAQAVAALDHVNIVRAYDVDKEDEGDTEIHFLVMEYVNGRSLLEIVSQDGPMDIVNSADYMRQAADGLTHAHQAGMVHRDIKPGNLLVDENDVVKILDLGLARFFSGENSEEEESLTVAHDEKVLGTADYLAPEQALDSHSVDARADIYSLGCTFYYMLTGHPPFTEGTLAQRLMAHQTKEPPAIEGERSEVPADLLPIIKRMMAKSLDDRYQTAGEVNEALKNWLLQNAGDDWRSKNSAIIGSDSSTVHGKGASSLKGVQEATEQPDTGTIMEPIAVPSDSNTSNVVVGAEDSNAGNDGNLAAFLSNLDLPAPATEDIAEAIDASESDSKANGAETETQKDAPIAEPVTAQAIPVLTEQPTEPPPTATPVQAIPVVTQPVIANPVQTAPVAVAAPTAQPVLPTAEPVAAAEPAERSFANRGKRRQRRGGNSSMFKPLVELAQKKQVRLAAAATVGVLLIGAVIYAGMSFLGSGDTEEQNPTVADSTDDKSTPADDDAASDETTDPGTRTSGPPKALSSGTLEVGPSAQFKTIAAALKHAFDNYSPKRLRSQLVIQVAGGKTYAERIDINSGYPAGIRIEAKAGPRPVLAPTGSQPVIKLDGVERFSIEGFDLKAAGKPAAIELSSYLTACQLKDLKVEGFTQTGVLCTGAVGVGVSNQELRLEQLEFHAASPKAIGIKCQQGTTDTSQLKISDCRFFGPLSVGILLQNSPTFIAVRGAIFTGLETGIKFDGSNMRVTSITVANCTFHQLDRGVVFTSMPSSASHGLMISRNVFSGLKGLETVVEEGFDSKEMYSRFSTSGNPTGWNWTTRAKPAAPANGEFDIFSNNGQMGAKIDFASTDASSDRFLAPSANAPWARGIPVNTKADTKTDVRPYAGAIGP